MGEGEVQACRQSGRVVSFAMERGDALLMQPLVQPLVQHDSLKANVISGQHVLYYVFDSHEFSSGQVAACDRTTTRKPQDNYFATTARSAAGASAGTHALVWR